MKVSCMINDWYKNITTQLECRSFSVKLSDYIDGRLDGATSWRTQNHIAVCRSCQKAVTELSSVSRILAASSRREVSSSFTDALEARIAALPAQKSGAALPLRTPVTRFRPSWNVASLRLTAPLAAAAAVLLFSLNAIKPITNTNVTTPPAPVALGAPDPTVYMDLHRVVSAGDPLSDSSAQLLGSTVDTIKVTPSNNHNLSDDDVSVLLD